MQTKLTLRLEKGLVEDAKRYAKQHEKSLSQIVADYFKALKNNKTDKEPLPPITKSLVGILKDKNVSEKDYYQHLEDKYL